jgi:hypothetical protein
MVSTKALTAPCAHRIRRLDKLFGVAATTEVAKSAAKDGAVSDYTRAHISEGAYDRRPLTRGRRLGQNGPVQASVN